MAKSSAVPSFESVRSWLVEERPSCCRSGLAIGEIARALPLGEVGGRTESERVRSIDVGREVAVRGLGDGEDGDVFPSVSDSLPMSIL